MGIVSGFMGLFGGGGSKNMGKALDIAEMGAKGVDAMFYTEEEKADAGAQRAQLKFKWGELAVKQAELTANESTMRSLSRRYLAWGVFSLGAFLTLYSLLMKTLAVFLPAYADKLEGVAAHSMALLKVWWPIILAAGVFYFGAHLIGLVGNKK